MLLHFNFSTELCELTNYFSPLLSPFWYDMYFIEEIEVWNYFYIMHTIEDNKIKPEKKEMCFAEIHFFLKKNLSPPASITKNLIDQILGNNY